MRSRSSHARTHARIVRRKPAISPMRCQGGRDKVRGQARRGGGNDHSDDTRRFARAVIGRTTVSRSGSLEQSRRPGLRPRQRHRRPVTSSNCGPARARRSTSSSTPLHTRHRAASTTRGPPPAGARPAIARPPACSGASSRGSASTYLPIEDHGVIGDLHSVALVGVDGTIDWTAPALRCPHCLRLDPGPRTGRVLPHQPGRRHPGSRQLYLPDTNVLLTGSCPEGVASSRTSCVAKPGGRPAPDPPGRRRRGPSRCRSGRAAVRLRSRHRHVMPLRQERGLRVGGP